MLTNLPQETLVNVDTALNLEIKKKKKTKRNKTKNCTNLAYEGVSCADCFTPNIFNTKLSLKYHLLKSSAFMLKFSNKDCYELKQLMV